MNLFISSTPYQVFNAINMCKNVLTDECSDLYILNVSKSSVAIYNKIKIEKIFRKVYLINVLESLPGKKVLYYLNRLNKIIFTKKVIPNKNDFYDSVFIVGTEVFSKAIYYYWFNKNKNIKLNFYEDGTGSYFRILMEDKKMIKHRVLSILKGFEITDKCDSLYVYRPSCVMSKYNKIRIKSIPLINKYSDCIDEIKKVLQKNEINIISRKIVFFDSDFGDYRILEQQIHFVNKLNEILNSKNYYIKFHPNSDRKLYGEKAEALKIEDAFEVINLNQDMSDKILISIASSACITPKLIFNEEPYIVFLYKLSKETLEYAPNFDEFIQKIVELYDSPEKIFIPTTVEEYFEILHKFKEQLL